MIWAIYNAYSISESLIAVPRRFASIPSTWHVARVLSTYSVFYHDLLITKLHHIDYKIILMAYMVQKIGFMASRKSNYLNERCNDEAYVNKCLVFHHHAKVTLLVAEFCSPTSASDKPKCILKHERRDAYLSALEFRQ
jgi:hypothetical protein